MLPSIDEGDGQNNANTKQYRNTTVLCWLHWKNVSCEYLSLLFCLLTLCSAIASALQIVFSNSLYESTTKWEMSNFQRRQTVSWNICNQNSYFIRCTQTAVSKVVTAYTYHGKASSAKWNSGWKSKLSGRDHCILTTV